MYPSIGSWSQSTGSAMMQISWGRERNRFAYRPKRSTEDAISTILHSALSHLDKSNIYTRMIGFHRF
ncbi:hypothetical protein QTP86_018479 [Hemibagrus guttatus]|nr:hypothetical protein QTP86_018479 [Hemibagrus guttatus]